MRSPARAVLLVFLSMAVIAIIVLSGVLLAKKGRSSFDKCDANMHARDHERSVFAAIDSRTLSPVISLSWNNDTKTYDIQFQIGKSTVSAAFDTGSAQTVIATTACGPSCAGDIYAPVQSGSSRAIINSVASSDGAGDIKTPCRTSIAYVSQTNTLQMYSDTVTLPRFLVANCAPQGAGIPTTPIIITEYPIGGIVENTGNSSVNVFGMSGVRSVNVAASGGKPTYPNTTCQMIDASTYDAPLLQSMAATPNTAAERMWSIRFSGSRKNGATVALGAPQRCLADRPLKVVKAIAALPDAPSAMIGTPYRYYAIPVKRATTFYRKWPLENFPKTYIVDTATTQFMIPVQPAVIRRLTRYGLILTLDNDEESTLEWEGRHTASPSVRAEDYDPKETPLFEAMSNAIAAEFSRHGNVAILGGLALRGRYVEFSIEDADTRTISFA